MNRRLFLAAAPLAWGGVARAQNLSGLAPAVALVEEHFPSRLHQFVWRNWELANSDRMAKVAGCGAAEIEALGRSMGLPPKRRLSGDYLKRIYVTAIRQNWHLLPEEQIIELLGWDAAHYRFTLKEDDFLDVKLQRGKPVCEPVRYRKPNAEQEARAAAMRASIGRWFGGGLADAGQPRFAFVEDFATPARTLPAASSAPPAAGDVAPHPGWRFEAKGAPPALTAAIEAFRAELRAAGASASRPTGRFEIALDAAAAGDAAFRLHAEEGLVRLAARSSRDAIRGLYHVRGLMEQRGALSLAKGDLSVREAWAPRYLYSYFALYGDPLMEGESAGLPDGYLDRAARAGVDGVWIQGVLNSLAPSTTYPEFGAGWPTRLKNLRALVARAEKFGLRVYLYINEPRAMPEEFFRNRPQIRGAKHRNLYAMCTSTEEVRAWLRQSLTHVFRETPGLGGIFTITMSENHTNCFSHGGAWGKIDPVAKGCPRCSRRKGADVIAELVHTFRDGVREASADASILTWDWGWGTPVAEGAIPKLPKDTGVISISEWSQPVNRGGVKAAVGEYSISVVGPGPRAQHHWRLAREAGLKAIAKTQFNNTWEMSAVPYIPVLPLVVQHCEGLAKAGVSGVMASWTCGGYPSPNLRAACAFAFEPRPSGEAILEGEARRMYGKQGAADALAAWRIFAEAFQFFPYGVAIYLLPTQHGPANLLRLKPTGQKPGMMLYPHDLYLNWKGAYPPDVMQRLVAQMASRWGQGLPKLEAAARLAPASSRKAARLELAIARTCHNHFESVANQIEFYLLRDEAPAAAPARQAEIRARMTAIARREIELARAQFDVARGESLIAFEATNHYYYTPLDLVEKMLNCELAIERLRA
jgi:hypothetical protein